MLAARLGELREGESLTQEQAAAKVGVTLRQWQRWEAGESVPYPRNLDLIASRFGLLIGEFFDETPRATLSARVEELGVLVAAVASRLSALELELELAESAERKQRRAGSSDAENLRRRPGGSGS